MHGLAKPKELFVQIPLQQCELLADTLNRVAAKQTDVVLQLQLLNLSMQLAALCVRASLPAT